MLFIVQQPDGSIPSDLQIPVTYPILLVGHSTWDDYGYRTTCNMYAQLEPNADVISLGELRIMRSGQTSHWLTNNQPEWTFQNGTLYFDRLDNHYCSLAVELSFYEKLSEIGDEFARLSLIALQDAAYNPNIWSRFESDSCFEASLLRNKSYAIEIRDKVRSMFQKESKLIETFSYEVQLPGASNAHMIQFDFSKTKALPNRLNIIAGTNGSGKTQLLARLAIELTGITSEEGGISELEKRQTAGRVTPTPSFYSVIAVSFNPFDQFERPTESPKSLFKYAYCGIRKPDNSIYSQDELVTLLRQLVEGAEEWQRNLLRRAARNVLGEAEFMHFLLMSVLSVTLP